MHLSKANPTDVLFFFVFFLCVTHKFCTWPPWDQVSLGFTGDLVSALKRLRLSWSSDSGTEEVAFCPLILVSVLADVENHTEWGLRK